ncbi:MAG TPA: glycosyltransferase family 4 protein [Baekduia sp.]|nr:glycosyltransferase family 4 protein [Baekduia sp.]
MAVLRLLTVGSMYPPHHQGGYEVVWRAFVRAARAAGHEVVVLASDHREPAAAGLPDDPGVHRDLPWWWRDHAFPRRSLPARLAIERRAARVFDAAVREHRPELVMWWAMGGMPLGLVARGARAGLPAVGVVHDAWPAYGPQVDQRVLSRPLDPGAVEAWSVNSAWLRDALVALPGWGAVAGRIRVDHPGIDPGRFAPVAAPAWRWRLLCVGRVEPRKGLAHAIDALAELPPEATLDIVGGGDEAHAAQLRAQADRLGLGERVYLRGPVADVPGAYAEADAVLFPVTWDEPFGLVPLEAMAVGRPVVGSATGGAREVLRDGDNALVVAPGDAAGLAQGVRRLAADEALRERLREGGAGTAATFTEQRFTAALLELVSAAGARRPRAGR